MQKPRKEYQLAKGYDIRIQRDGSDWRNEKQWACAIEGTLPAVWEEIKQDPTVISARICPGYQRTWRADRRQIIDEYQRPL